MIESLGPLEALPLSIAAREFADVERCFRDDARFRALTPGRSHQADTAADTAALFANWFGQPESLELVTTSVEAVRDRSRLAYQLHGVDKGGAFVCEQTAYCTIVESRIAVMDLVCSGFRRTAGGSAAKTVHDYDAGELGCGTGLPGVVRQRLSGIAIGDQLRIVTRDASAREDLPALARLLGQRVVSVQRGDGTTIITLERAK